MANIKSAQKRIRVTERKTLRNKMIRSQIRTLVKKYNEFLDTKSVDEATQMLPDLSKKLDQSVAKGIFKKETISRTKSRLRLKLNKLQS